jgi:hypothetical protein
MGEQFDDLARAMAVPKSRRTLLKGIVTAAAAATAATVLRPFRGEATVGCPAGAPTCGSGCCQKGETCSDPSTVCCCPSGTTPCGTTCCTKGVACMDAASSTCGCPSGTTPCGSGANLTCCGKGKACGDASCQPVSSFSSNVAMKCNPCGTGTVLFTDDFNSDFAGDCRTGALTNWTIEAGGNVDVISGWPGASGNVVDLDGSANICGGNGTPLVTKTVPITIVSGRTYTVCFRIGTNPSPFLPLGGAFDPNKVDINTMTVHFGPVSNSFTKNPGDPFTTGSLSFVAGANGSAPLTFQEDGLWDRGGILLDTVTITEKP